MTSSVRIYAGTQEDLFLWRSRTAGGECRSVFQTGTIDPSMAYAASPTSSIWASRKTACIEDDAGKSWRRVFEGNVGL